MGIALIAPKAAQKRAGMPAPRPVVSGKFIFIGRQKFYARGVTYGPFQPDQSGEVYHDLDQIDADFRQMAAAGINTVRIYSMPQRALLDFAQRHGLRVMVSLAAEQYLGYLADRKKKSPDVAALVRERVRQVAGHPALLCYSIGNELPASVVRWLGARRVESYLRKIFRAIKAQDPDGLVTYVNYPTTEYLRLPFLDLVCFNVYLESEAVLYSYLLRLQNIAGDRPLIMSEVGFDALRNGEDKQARVLDWQTRTAFRAGCAGAIIFSWTDEWYRGAFITDWAFGLTDFERRPKPALTAVQTAFAETPFPRARETPRFSIVICTYNGAATIRETLEGVRRLAYPNYEVIVVDDGSTDATAAMVAEFDVRLICTKNQGLSEARNVGWRAADGEHVAYLDDDAYPDPQWLDYLAVSFLETDHAGMGGPNVLPPQSGLIEHCVANSPGGPVHVLLTDELAEHIPGCNMAFRRTALEAVGGFDPRFRAAGDDVDFCWRIQQRGWTLGFSPAATVWHHRRNSIRKYWRQQRGYGEADALLEAKWPERYNSAGHHTFSGRIYAPGVKHILTLGSRIYHGVWGSAPFQSLYERKSNTLLSLPAMPEWHLLIWFLAGCSLLGWSWPPLFFAVPLLVAAVTVTIIQSLRAPLDAGLPPFRRYPYLRLQLWLLTAWLHFVQPLARLSGRLGHGLTLWRKRCSPVTAFSLRHQGALLRKDWVAPEQRVSAVLERLRSERIITLAGSEFDRWDLDVHGGMFGSARFLMAAEDWNGGQLIRTRIWARWRRGARLAVAVFGLLAAAAALDHAWIASAVCAIVAGIFALWAVRQSSGAMAALMRATLDLRREPA
ncbi:MAG: glycosyltransferase [Verrucomicrobiales bacterium]